MTTATGTAADLLERLFATRDLTERLAAPLEREDQVVQSMPFVSPTKWHRAHTTWFFETFVLGPHQPGYRPVHPAYDELFNSYYHQIGPQHPREQRGLLSRPTVDEVTEYRCAVDRSLRRLLEEAPASLIAEIAPLIELGINHEQQHQELLLMDIKHVFWMNPLRPAYRLGLTPTEDPAPEPPAWIRIEPDGEGRVPIGSDGTGFAYDNEGPRHDELVRPFLVMDRLVTEAEWVAFIDDGGYERPELWLSDGWALARREGWRAPLYWDRDAGGDWEIFTLGGSRPPNRATPVAHISHYEADAYATWAGARLPTEAEWETTERLASAADPVNDLSADRLHPRPAAPGAPGVRQMLGDGWEWTGSAYLPYPGYRPPAGAIGEYNGKFMSGQIVLRGGAPVTPAGHTRPTYRNFFPPDARWPFTTLRLVHDERGPAPRPSHSVPAAAAEDRSAPTPDPSPTPAEGDPGGPATDPEAPSEPRIDVHLQPEDLDAALRADVRRGFTDEEAWLPPKWFYDDRGSELFDEITRLDVYYQTECERSILRERADEIVLASGADTIVELGSGTSDKTETLLAAFEARGTLRAFLPFDVSEATLRWSASVIARAHPEVRVHGIVGDLDHHLDRIPSEGRQLVAFLGGTIGNYDVAERADLLAAMAARMRSGDSLLLGLDLVKDPARLVAAYDDPDGITAAFDLNVLEVLRERLDAELDVSGWRHAAVWDPENERIEMRLHAIGPQRIHIPSVGVDRLFADGEAIRTEISAKFRRTGIEAELSAAGLDALRWWTDADGDFALVLAMR